MSWQSPSTSIQRPQSSRSYRVDTVLTFGALFADSNPVSDALIGITVAAMAILFLAARYAIGHPAIEKSIENHAHRITPFILIIVGAYILVDTATDVL